MSTNRGRGIEKICRECTQYGNPSPDYSLSGSFVTVSFNAVDMPQAIPVAPAVQLTERQLMILDYLREHPGASYEDVSAVAEVTRRTAATELSALKEMGLLAREGSDKKGVWLVCKIKNM